jgi:amino acid transporter
LVLLGTSGLVAAYVLVALLLLILNLYTRWAWQLKAALIALVSAFFLVTYFSLPPLLGWPTDADLPKRFNLVAIFVQEPDKTSGAPGEIYLWATDMVAGSGATEPRAYRVPFSSELHARIVEAGNKMRKGMPQIGEIREEPPASGGRPTDESHGGQKSVAIEFFDLPDPLFPDK